MHRGAQGLSAAFAAAILLAACGQERDAPAASGPAQVVVKIAHAGPLTGSIAHQGKDDENGVALAVSDANAMNLVIGGKRVKFEMMSEDDQADPKIGTLVAQKLVDAKVAAVIGHLNSGVSIPASDIYAKAGIPMISGSATNPTLTERGLKTVFRTVGRDDEQGPAIALYIAQQMKARRVAIIDDKTAYGEGIAAEVEKALRAAKVEIVARELGIKARFTMGDGACDDEITGLSSGAAEGMVCSQAGLPREAASAEFTKAFNAKFGKIQQYSPLYYDATNAVIEAMRKADSLEPGKFTPELFNVSFGGATGTVAFDGNGDRRDAEMTIFKMVGARIKPVAMVKNGDVKQLAY